ncbi:hypothetical protein HO856_02035 [Streptococcus suis]|nr:hypothetical protein [Streptococcus suis]HEM5587184.1 hypothetical protein [Streptococcus suis]
MTKSDSWLGFSLCENGHKYGKEWYNKGVYTLQKSKLSVVKSLDEWKTFQPVTLK